MPLIDLTRYIVASSGTWLEPPHGGEGNLFHFSRADCHSASRLMLRWAGDFVALTGPLSIRVTVQAENMTVPLALVGNLAPDYAGYVVPGEFGVEDRAELRGQAALDEAALARFGKGRGLSLQASTIYSYTLEIPAGQAWPFSLSEALDAMRLRNFGGSRYEQIGNNLGYRVLIEPAFALSKLPPVARGGDLPCDFAVADQPETPRYFPAPKERQTGGFVTMPDCESQALATPAAEGGSVRTRFFNGMFITREDLETEQRYMRLKFKLHNRAAGEGVVWGLAVGREADAICVAPGYGVDCCGNDLTLTSIYKVPTRALLADPAAAVALRRHGAHKMNLLLEFVECPSDPRPVHGDPCASERDRCETSRIRETVRLRLVPPRNCVPGEDSEPIKRFLEEVKRLRARYPLHGAAAGDYARAPFQIRLTATKDKRPQDVTLRPTAQGESRDLKLRADTLSIQILPDQMWGFAQGVVTGTLSDRNGAVSGAVDPPGSADLIAGAAPPQLVFTFPAEYAQDGQIDYKISGWLAQTSFAGQDDPGPGGDLTLTVKFNQDRTLESCALKTTIDMTAPRLEKAPCSGDPCAPGYSGRGGRDEDCSIFGKRGQERQEGQEGQSGDATAYLPWLHADPSNRAAAGDPKVLALAMLGGWLTEMLARERFAGAGATRSARRRLAELIYRYAWMMLFGVSPKADSSELGRAIKRLLEGWCQGLLWQGPKCCGEPHGVVIACCVVEGGAITHVDPFGGRRYVIHYPLLAHWGQQFGLAPPDVSAMRLFAKICCLGSLSGDDGRSEDIGANHFAFGAGVLHFGHPEKIAQTLDADASIVARRKVGLPELIATGLSLLGGAKAQGAADKAGAATTDTKKYEALLLDDLLAGHSLVLTAPVA